MPEQVNPANQTTHPTTPQTKQPLNWKKIGIIAAVALLLIGGGTYATVVLGLFGTSEPVQDKVATTSSKPTDNTPMPTESKLKNQILLTWEEKIAENKYTNGIYSLDPNNPPPKKILDNPNYIYPANNPTGADNTMTTLEITKDGKYVGWWKYSGTASPSVGYVQTDDLDFAKAKKLEVKQKTDYLEDFVWSPNGQKIAILERQGDGPKFTYKIRIFEAKSASQVAEFQVASLEQQHSLGFAWSESDKLRIIFVTKYTPTEEYKAVSYSPTGTKEFEKIIHSGENRLRPIFDISKDGENIAFVKKSQPGSSDRGELWYGNFDGTSLKKIADTTTQNCTNGSPLDISPNKTLVVVGGGCSDGTKGKVINLANGTAVTSEVALGSPIWSPDSKQIWVSESLHNSTGALLSQNNYILNTDGKIVKKLDFYAAEVVWFP